MPHPDVLYILCAANAAYAMPLSVMLTSAIVNTTTPGRIKLYVIDSDFTDELKQRVQSSVLKNVNPGVIVEFFWKRLDDDMGEYLPEVDENYYLSKDSYSRLFAGDVLPSECEVAVYLDADMVVLRDLNDLVAAANPAATISATTGVFYPYVSTDYAPGKPVVFNYAELGIDRESKYFNAGVMVLNMKHWRDRRIGEKTIAYLAQNHKNVFLHDQGGLNAILHDQWWLLDQRWNQCGTVLEPSCWQVGGYSLEQWRQVIDGPYVVHYDGGRKPWHNWYTFPRLSYFNTYLQKTDYANSVNVLPIERLEKLVGVRNYFYVWQMFRQVRRTAKPLLRQISSLRRGSGNEAVKS